MLTFAIEVSELQKKFGDLEAVKKVNFKVKRGEIFAFLGPNGAGKTTTINMLITILTPTSGTASVNGYDILAEPTRVRRSIGTVFQEQTLDEDITALDNIMLHARMYGISKREAKQKARELLELTSLWERRNSRVRTFSGGMRRRLELARGLLTDPQTLFLDEPTIGLDPQSRSLIWEKIQDIGKEKDVTIFLTSHQMDEVETFADRVAIMDLGEIKAMGTPDELKASIGEDVVRLTVTSGQASELSEKLEANGFHNKLIDKTVEIGVANGAEFLGSNIQQIMNFGVPIHAIEVKKPMLNDVFLHYTGRELRDAMASFADQMNMVGVDRRLRRRRH